MASSALPVIYATAPDGGKHKHAPAQLEGEEQGIVVFTGEANEQNF
jgi:hypothetical protein